MKCAASSFYETVDKEVEKRTKRNFNIINRQQAEVEKQSQNFKVLVSDHRVLQQSFDNLKGLYEDEKLRAEKLKEKCIYFIKELQEAEAEIGRVTARAAEWKDATYTYADSIDRVKAEAIKEFADNLCRVFAGHSDYHGDTILTKIICLKEGNPIQNAKPIDTSKIKSAAIKKFAEKYKTEINERYEDIAYKDLFFGVIDYIVKEMVGES